MPLERFWNEATGDELRLYEEAHNERLRDLKRVFLWAAWHSSCWALSGPPKWEEVEEMLTGKPKPVPTPDELLAKAKASGRGTWTEE